MSIINDINKLAYDLIEEYYEEEDYYSELYFEGEQKYMPFFMNKYDLVDSTYARYEWLDIFRLNFKDKKFYSFCMNILLLLRRYEDSGNLHESISNLIKLYKIFIDDNLPIEIKNILKNPKFNKVKNDIDNIDNEINRYKSFHNNQNVYDNMLSIIKIFKRIDDKLLYNMNFSLNNEENENILYNYKNNLFKEFSTFRFLI